MNEKFLSKDLDAQKYEREFGSKDRDVIAFSDAIISELKLKKGEKVADVGAGTGAFLPGLSTAVGPKGKVYGVEISPVFVDHLKKKMLNQANVHIVQGTLETTTLADQSLDVVLVVDTYHHFDHPSQMLADFKRVLKKGGRLAIVDFNKTPEARPWIQDHIRLGEDGYIKEIESAGFKFSKKPAIPFKENFMLIFNQR